MTVDASRTLKNTKDTARKWPTEALADDVMKDSEGVVCERITGPAGHATVKLSRPAKAIRNIQSFATATGVASTGAGKKEYLTESTDFTVNLNDASNGNVCTLTEVPNTNYSAETWVVWYSPAADDGTIGGQSRVGH